MKASLQFLKHFRLCLVLVLAGWAFQACDRTTEGNVALPRFLISCQSDNCKSYNGQVHVAAIYISSSGCSNLDFGLAVTGTTNNIVCNGLGCTGEVSQWRKKDTNELTTEIGAGFYSICALIDFNSSLSGAPPMGDPADANFVLDNVNFSALGSAVSLTDWIDP
jgi:hypothetical protein